MSESMLEAPLRRDCLAQVLRDLLLQELATIRRRGGLPPRSVPLPEMWGDDVTIEGDLGCDSLERLWLSAAANEMFCLYESGLEGNLNTAETFGGWIDVIEDSWKAGVQHVTFSTSGSTGEPKRLTHSFAFLRTEIEYVAGLFRDCRRILSLVSGQHIYGFLFAAMLPTHLGIEVVPAGNWSAGTMAGALRAGDLVVATPPRWDWLERSVPRWPPGVRGVNSGGRCAPPILDSLGQRGVSLTEVYGSSETAGIATRSWPAQAYRLMPQWRMAEIHGEGSGAPSDAQPAEIVHTSGAAYALPDRLSMLDAQTFVLGERVDQAVQVGGINVFPARVADVLRTVSGVAEVAVRQGSVHAGGRLKAFVVGDGTVPEAEMIVALEEASRRALNVPEQVKDFAFGAELPRSASGKLCDW